MLVYIEKIKPSNVKKKKREREKEKRKKTKMKEYLKVL